MFFFRKREKKMPFVSAVIAASGSSTRMGGENKLLMEIGEQSVLAHTLLAFQNCSMISEIVIAARGDMIIPYSNLATELGIDKLKVVVAGGKTRCESVYAGARQVSDRADYIAVHDGARPLIRPEEIVSVCEKAFTYTAAAAAVPVKDTIKIVEDGRISETVDRSRLWAMQTPQVADRALLMSALKNAIDQNLNATDECMALEAIHVKPAIVMCSYENIKITTPEDVLFARAILAQREE